MKRFASASRSIAPALFTLAPLAPEARAQVFDYAERGHYGSTHFGAAISPIGDVDADGCEDFIAGAVGGNAALVFSGKTGAKLMDIFGHRNAGFGTAVDGKVDADGDGFSDVLIGAPLDSTGANAAGRVLIYSPHRQRNLVDIIYTNANGWFGYSLRSLESDLDGDGSDDFVVGIIGEAAASVRSGATGAEIFHLTGQYSTSFGNSVSPAGDLDADGITDIAVGIPFNLDSRGFVVGGVAAFSGKDGSALWLVDGPGDVRFGWAIGNVGDLDGDGHGDLVVGAPDRELSSTVVTGSVTVLSGASGSVLYESFGAYNGDEFGISVRTVGGDIDGDGANDFIVGAPQGGGFYPSHGYAQTISGASGAVLNTFVEYSYDSTLSIHYGAAVAGGDFDGDGRPDVLIGDDFFSGSNGIVEAWTTAAAGWSNYDAGWAGTLGVPSLTAGSNPVIGQPIDVDVGNSAVAATAGLLLVGVHATKIPTGKGGPCSSIRFSTFRCRSRRSRSRSPARFRTTLRCVESTSTCRRSRSTPERRRASRSRPASTSRSDTRDRARWSAPLNRDRRPRASRPVSAGRRRDADPVMSWTLWENETDAPQPIVQTVRGATCRRLILAALLAWAAFLRLPLDNSGNAGWTLERLDEVHYVSIAQRFLLGDWEVNYYINPTFFPHVLQATTRVVGQVRVAAGLDPSFERFAEREAVDPHWLIRCGRALSVGASVLTVAVLVALGRRLFSPSVGWIAGLALATDQLAAQRAALVGNESLMTFLIALAFLVRIGQLHAPSTRRLLLGGLLIGLAASTKYSAGVFLVPLLLFRPFTPARVAAVAGAALAGFIAGSPGILLHFAEFARDLRLQYGYLDGGYLEEDVTQQSIGFVYYLAGFPRQNLGIAFAIACAIGILGMLWRSVFRADFRCTLVLAASLPLYGLLGRGIFHYARFLLPAVPFVLLAGAAAIAATTHVVAAWARSRWRNDSARRIAPAASLLLGVALVAPGLPLTWKAVTARARATDPRAEVIDWAKSLLPVEARCSELVLAEPYALFGRTSVELRAGVDPALSTRIAREQEQLIASGRWRSTVPLDSLMSGAPTLVELQHRLQEGRIDFLVVDFQKTLVYQPMRLPHLTANPALRDFKEWAELYAWLRARRIVGQRIWKSDAGLVQTSLIDLRS